MNITRRTLLKSLTALLIPVSALDARAAAPVTGRIIQIRPQGPAWKQLKVEVGLGS